MTLREAAEAAIEKAVDEALGEIRRQGGADYLLKEARSIGVDYGMFYLRSALAQPPPPDYVLGQASMRERAARAVESSPSLVRSVIAGEVRSLPLEAASEGAAVPTCVNGSSCYAPGGCAHTTPAAQTTPEEDVVALTPAEFDRLLEYSTTIPTGKVVGKQWKRRQCNEGAPDEWFLGEYVADPDPKMIGIRWRRIEIAPAPPRDAGHNEGEGP